MAPGVELHNEGPVGPCERELSLYSAGEEVQLLLHPGFATHGCRLKVRNQPMRELHRVSDPRSDESGIPRERTRTRSGRRGSSLAAIRGDVCWTRVQHDDAGRRRSRSAGGPTAGLGRKRRRADISRRPDVQSSDIKLGRRESRPSQTLMRHPFSARGFLAHDRTPPWEKNGKGSHRIGRFSAVLAGQPAPTSIHRNPGQQARKHGGGGIRTRD